MYIRREYHHKVKIEFYTSINNDIGGFKSFSSGFVILYLSVVTFRYKK